MYRWLGGVATRRPRLVLLAALGFLVASLVAGAGAAGRLKTQGYDDPSSESSFAARVTAPYRGTAPNLVVVAQAPRGGVDAPAARDAGQELTRRLAAQPHVSEVSSYWSGGADELRGRDGRSALLLAHVDGDGKRLGTRAEQVREALSARPAGGRPVLKVHVGGKALVDAQIQDITASDLKRAEAVVLPGTLVLLVLVFGSVVAAALPLLIGVLAIGGTLLVLSLLGGVTDVSVFALNLTTALGLGLGIDYGLLVVSRFREELTAGHRPRDAARRTVATAGHTVFFSAATVCAALATLLVFPPYFLRSFAYAGIAVVALAMVAATTVLPALLALLGHRVNAWAVPWRRRVRAGSASRFWERLARIVVRRPVVVALPVLALLVLLAGPLTHAGFATPDDRTLPTTASSRRAGDLVRAEFDVRNAGALTVFTTSRTPEAARDYAPGLSELPGVAEVRGPSGVWRAGEPVTAPGSAATGLAPAGADGPAIFSVVPSADPQSHAAQRLVRAIRETPVPAGTDIHVGGPSAVLVDAKDTVVQRLPLAAAMITVSTFALLFLFSRSLLLPLKAIALNGLSLAAVLGAMVWIFQTGHLRTLLGFTPGPLSPTMPVLLFCIVFGLSVDYEVFVLARIKEAHDAGHDTAGSIVTGVARTGGIVTAAGTLLAFTLLSFGTSRVALLQFFGIGAGFGVLLDATLVRGVLVPALMRLAGGLNWWAPRPFGGRTPGRPPPSAPAPAHPSAPAPAHPSAPASPHPSGPARPPPAAPAPQPPSAPTGTPPEHLSPPSRIGCPPRAPEPEQVSP
ncbi:MMPL family transporter [Streptomyces sp. HUCO-GS316]|uniref:MMPL family transporter n=1 Tax=Streptomyces sp. HUCO-GS316 TaxID=2692198 RepID=UPI00136A3164|nr:MMPL family transporter [Streptomyces sp. HUCO-GS316]MXM63949.1 MMPL family transporter [Streptomyces sp. HUCO-GS316]